MSSTIHVSKHNIPRAFWDFLNQSGPVNKNGQIVTERLIHPWFYASGQPISDAYWAKVQDQRQATDTLIQAFERRVLTYVPSNPPGFQVEMGNIGAHYRDWRYGGPGRMGSFPLAGPHPGYGFNVWLFDVDATACCKAPRPRASLGAPADGLGRLPADPQPHQVGPARPDRGRRAGQRRQADPERRALARLGRGTTAACRATSSPLPASCTSIAKRYKGKVAAYEIWNEQNYAAESGGLVNLGQYVDLLQVGYSAVKYADPSTPSS